MQPELAIIIVSWNSKQFLKQCLESVSKSISELWYEVWVVDNGSTDGTIEWLGSSDVPEIFSNKLTVIENRENLGYGIANNQAIRASSAPYLLLLNPDTVVLDGAADSLLHTLISDARFGVCAPRLINPDGSLQPNAWRSPPAAWHTLVEGFQLYRLIPTKFRGELLLGQHWNHATRRRVGGFSGAAMMIKRQALNSAGMFDERVDLYGEEADLFHRMTQHGWWLVFEPTAQIVHFGGQSTKTRWTDHEIRLRQVEAHLRMQQRYMSRIDAASNMLASLVVLGAFRAINRVRGRDRGLVNQLFQMNLKYLKRTLF